MLVHDLRAGLSEIGEIYAGSVAQSRTGSACSGLLQHQLHPAGPAHRTLTGTDLDTALRQRVSEPLGLEATRFAAVETANPDGLAAPWALTVFDGDPKAAYDCAAPTCPANVAGRGLQHSVRQAGNVDHLNASGPRLCVSPRRTLAR